jgi:hypothetical protein
LTMNLGVVYENKQERFKEKIIAVQIRIHIKTAPL